MIDVLSAFRLNACEHRRPLSASSLPQTIFEMEMGMSEEPPRSGVALTWRQNLVIMKFGGTSVEDAPAIGRLIQNVRSRSNFSRVVVVSALARVTDELILLGKAAGDGRLKAANESLLALRQRHERVARELLNRE